MQIWIDVEDLLLYAAQASRPTGIQRLAFDLQCALVADVPGEVHFVRHGAGGFVSVDFAEVLALFKTLAQTDKPAPAAAKPGMGAVRRLGRSVVGAMPLESAGLLRQFNTHQRAALRALYRAARAFLKRNARAGTRHDAGGVPAFAAHARPGDWLLSLGSPWNVKDYAGLIQAACARHGLRFGMLIYDIVPLRRPEWCDKGLTAAFTTWFRSVAPLAEALLAISHTTAGDASAYAAETGLALRSPVHPIPIGTSFGQPAPSRTARLPPPGSFVLFVSTIEARKNHLLLFRVWRELLDTTPHDQVPTLVFAGRVGWLVQDLMQQLDNADWLGGKIRLIEGPSDGELAALYEDCLFTMYPSLFEGWGLPITESLAHGAPCLAADATSLPEAGGTLARYFDPANQHDAVRAVRALLDDRAGLAAWRAEIRAGFIPVPWQASTAEMLRILRAPC